MNTHDRKRALLDWLRESGSVTAEEAAKEFGVSLRTLHRDIAALRLEGIPVEGEPGRGGGIKLDPMAAVPSVTFEPDEVVDLLLTPVSRAQQPKTPRTQRFCLWPKKQFVSGVQCASILSLPAAKRSRAPSHPAVFWCIRPRSTCSRSTSKTKVRLRLSSIA